MAEVISPLSIHPIDFSRTIEDGFKINDSTTTRSEGSANVLSSFTGLFSKAFSSIADGVTKTAHKVFNLHNHINGQVTHKIKQSSATNIAKNNPSGNTSARISKHVYKSPLTTLQKPHNLTLNINANLGVRKKISVGAAATINGPTTLNNSLKVGGPAIFKGSVVASRGIATNGANINAGTGRIFAANIISSIKAGKNIIITGTSENPIISFGGESSRTVFLGGSGSSQQITATAPLVYNSGQLSLQTVPIANGGTGTTTLTGILKGNGVAGAIQTATPGVDYLTGAAIASGTQGQFPFYDASGNSIVATSSLFLVSNGNVGIGTTSPLSILDAYGDLFISGANRYLNFGTTTATGIAGYGFRDNSGSLQFKNSGGTWSNLISSSGAFTSSGGSTYLSKITDNVGIGTTTPNPSAELDISSTNKGFLLPRIALVSSTSSAPLLAHVAGMVVYNTATTWDMVPGVYVDDGTSWRLAAPIPVTMLTASVSGITTTTAVSGGTILTGGGSGITASGVVWSTTADPTVALSTKTVNTVQSGSFTSSIAGLSAGTTYYVRAYATNSTGTTYGNQITFSTIGITTTAVTNITKSTAIGGGIIANGGGATILASGIIWGTNTSLTVSLSTKTINTVQSGSFTSNITGLSAGTTYSTRAYITNSTGTTYGNQVAFVTLPGVNTTAITNVTGSTAISGGTVTNGGATITASGVVWSTTADPTVALSTKTVNTVQSGSFTSSIAGLSAGTTYYVRAYATNSTGTTYGNQITFSTIGIITTAITGVTDNTATSGGNITTNGGTTITASGVVWGTTVNPTIATVNKTVNTVQSGSFTSNITGLSGGTTYYARAYATNNTGTTYGNQVAFVTLPGVNTTAITNVTGSTAISGGTVTNGGTTITASGVVWSTASDPTIVLSTKTINTVQSGSFTSNLTGLVAGTTYYARAYATNNTGTTYGNQIIFSVIGITTTTVTGVTSNAATSGGNITTNGGTTITASGVVWSITADPTIALSTKTVNTVQSGSFTSNIAGLSGGTTYYARAYATNSTGTTYGNQVTLVTLPEITTTSITAVTGSTAISGGTVTNGGATITASGVVWSTTANPTAFLITKTVDTVQNGMFKSTLTGLATSTLYYVRAYATNNTGTAYGNQVLVKILPGTAVTYAYTGGVQTYTVPSSNATSVQIEAWGAEGGGGAGGGKGGYAQGTLAVTPGEVLNLYVGGQGGYNGGGGGAAKGGGASDVRVGTTALSGRVIVAGAGGAGGAGGPAGGAGGGINGTSGGNNIPAGCGYGGGGGTSSAGGAGGGAGAGYAGHAGAGAAGVGGAGGVAGGGGGGSGYYGGGGGGSGYYCGGAGGGGSSYLGSLTGTTTTSGVRTGNGQIIITSYTNSAYFPTVTTTAITGVTGNSAISGGNITANIGSAILASGVVWSTTANPTIATVNKTVNTTVQSGPFTSTITKLVAGTTYYVRAYSTNSSGTAYGNQVTFSTLAGVTTTSVTGVTGSTAISGGTVTNGGATITASGVVWSTTADPTVALSTKTINTVQSGAFTSTITGLATSTLYYIRAYATNSGGTTYGNQVLVKIVPVPGTATTFAYTDAAQTYVVPVGVSSVQIEEWGAQGTVLGGDGGYAKGTLTVTPGEVLNVYVGGQGGYNGGGAAGCGGTSYTCGNGGGASDVRVSTTSLSGRVMVAAGGGGGAGTAAGGTGGGITGSTGGAITGGTGGGGGSATSGGASYNTTAGAGGYGYGGIGAGGGWYGGGGGSGYYGGGGGYGYGGGGGGGSSYLGNLTNAITTSGVRTGNGQIIITPPPYVNGADLAENYPTKDISLVQGDLISLDTANPGFVKKATRGERIIGIYSTSPYTVMGKGLYNGNKKVQVALAGRVPTKVDTENGSIKVGDKIALSSTPGIGMKAFPWSASVGYALSSYSGKGVGTINVFINTESGSNFGNIPFNPILYTTSTSTLSTIAAFGFLTASSTNAALADGALLNVAPYIHNVITYIQSKVNSGMLVMKEFVVGRIVAATGYFKRIFANEICLTNSSNSVVCVTAKQLKKIGGSIYNINTLISTIAATSTVSTVTASTTATSTIVSSTATTTNNQNNTYLGYRSGYNAAVDSSFNTLLGYQSGLSSINGSHNILLGANVDVASTTGSRQLNIGNVLYGTGIYNGTMVSSTPSVGARLGIGTTSPSQQLALSGLLYVGGTGTSTIQNNLRVDGALYAKKSYVDDLIFGKGYRFTEAMGNLPHRTLFLKNSIGTNLVAFDGNGNMGIGTTAPYSRLTIFGIGTTSSTTAFTIANSASTTEFQVKDNGDAFLAGSLVQNSDRRLKTNIQLLSATSSLAAITELTPIHFNWRSSSKSSVVQFGFTAQDVQKIFPNLVSTTSPTMLTSHGTLSLNYIGLISPIVSSIKDLALQVSGFAQSITTKVFTATTGHFTKKLCVGDTCINGAQLKMLLLKSEQNTNVTASGMEKSPVNSKRKNSSKENTGSGTASTSTSTSTSTSIMSTSSSTTNIATTTQAAASTTTPTCTLLASPASVTKGSSSKLTWTTTNAKSLFINNNIGTSTSVSAGYTSVSLTSTTTYTGTVKSVGGKTATCDVIINVTIPPDTTPPVVTLNGSATMKLTVGSIFTDPGATAEDNVDGDLTSQIIESGKVSTTTAGKYILTYSATDKAGNTGAAERNVIVVSTTTPSFSKK